MFGCALAPYVTGSEAQVRWAQKIRLCGSRIDRVATSLRSIAAWQTGDNCADTSAILAIPEQKRDEVFRYRFRRGITLSENTSQWHFRVTQILFFRA